LRNQLCIPVHDSSQVGQARRAAADLSRRIGFDETQAGRIALAASEAATNLAKHASNGRLLLTTSRNGMLELLAIDTGPGIPSPARAMDDGYSTAGSSGTGLGALRRLSDQFDLYSTVGKGTVLVARFLRHRPNTRLNIASVCLPVRGEQVSGDDWSVAEIAGKAKIAVADGLGHGPAASEAASEAMRVFQKHQSEPPGALLARMNDALRKTRGAAAAVSEIDFTEPAICFAGIGNIASTVYLPDNVRKMVSHNGTLGHQIRKVQEFRYPWARNALLVMNSDGLGTGWRLEDYPGLAACDPAVIAGVLYRDFTRGRDDVTVVVAKQRSEWQPESSHLL